MKSMQLYLFFLLSAICIYGIHGKRNDHDYDDADEDWELTPAELKFINSIVSASDVVNYVKEKATQQTIELKELDNRIDVETEEYTQQILDLISTLRKSQLEFEEKLKKLETLSEQMSTDFINEHTVSFSAAVTWLWPSVFIFIIGSSLAMCFVRQLGTFDEFDNFGLKKGRGLV